MNEQFHVIIAGDHRTPFSFRVSAKTLLFSVITILCVTFTLVSTSFFTTGFLAYNKILVKRMSTLKEKMSITKGVNKELEKKLAQMAALNSKKIEDIENKNRMLLSRLELEKNKIIAELEKKNLQQELLFREEKNLLISTAVSELNSRSDFIDSIISDIGIKVESKEKEVQDNSGGPFVAAENATYDELLYRADHYLETMQSLPLGKPVDSSVSSWFGKRLDPLNSKKAFHEGIDFRGKKGDPVVATGDGTVIFAGVNGGYGKYIKIDHGGGFTTSYAHLHNYHVKKGDYVTRGQTIGLLGNSGRSTGAHLHYEIAYKGKLIDPSRFMKVANLTYAPAH